MKLVASLVVRNELSRYLEPCVEHLRGFCDEIVVLDDGSDDGTEGWLAAQAVAYDSRAPIRLFSRPKSQFFADESHTRQRLLGMTLSRDPTHVLAIDADEFVTDGAALRALIDGSPEVPVWSLQVEEVWKADSDRLFLREDGGWRSHGRPLVWRVPTKVDGSWRIRPRKLACGRLPMGALRLRARETGVSLLHFGWANPAERRARHARYAEHDRGRYHARAHLDSILWPDGKVRLRDREWPEPLLPMRDALIPAATVAA